MPLAAPEALEDVIHAQGVIAHLDALRESRLEASEKDDTEPEKQSRDSHTVGQPREIRLLADLKLNQLHLHFSDNEGFRIESESHPEVVSKQHLTKRQVGEIVEYARRRHIRVTPELDMPGHLRAALAEHPELRLAGSTDALDISLPAAKF